MRRLFTLCLLLVCALPVGVSLSGCGSKSGGSGTQTFCTGSSGIKLGQVTTITLQPQVYGLSLDFGQLGNTTTPTAADCKGTAVSVTAFKYASSDQSLVDINPATGALCGGQWNRNVGSGVADFTFCTATNKVGVAQVTASTGGAVSNQIPVYVHPVATTISLVPAPKTAQECTTNPASTCAGCIPTTVVVTAPGYDNASCISQNATTQIAARVFDAGGNNITCQAGHLTFTPVTAGLVTIDANGVATAQLPGSTIVTARVSNATSTAGLFATCPPKSIAVTTPNAVTTNGVTSVNVNPNNTETITATVLDTNNVQITGLNLTYTSTTPTTVTATSTGIIPTFPSSAAINAFCQPPACNPSPYINIGLYGNGKPVASNTIVSNTTGVNGTLLWIASTDSRYVAPVDFTTSTIGAPVQLPYNPNSMVISQDGTAIYMGSDFELMTFSPLSNGISKEDISIKGTVLAVAPDNSSVVVSDPLRKTVYLYSPGGVTTGTGSTASTTAPSIITSYGGSGVRAQYAPDSQTLYVATVDNQVLIYSVNTGWHAYDMSASGAKDVAVTVPAVGAFIAGNTANPAITGRSYCANTNTAPVDFYPVAGQVALPAERLSVTNDSRHILAAHVAAAGGTPQLHDIQFDPSAPIPVNACPANGTGATFTNTSNTLTLNGATATAVTGVYTTSNSTNSFVTYLAPTTAPTSGTILPSYKLNATGIGVVSNVTLAAGATAPVIGVFSADNGTFYVGTSGDNQVHLITNSSLTDTRQINPRLPSLTTPSGFAVPNLLVQKPRPIT